jgi:hypothetical protein
MTCRTACSKESTTASDTCVLFDKSASPVGEFTRAGKPPGTVPIGKLLTPTTTVATPAVVT